MRYSLWLLGCLLLSALLADSAAPGPRPPLAAQWKKIDALLAKNRTADAAPLVEKIYQQARQTGDAPAYVRALLYKIRLLENKENDSDEKAIALLEADLQTAKFPARPVLHSLLAGLYADYFNAHRWQLYERTPGAAPTAAPAAGDAPAPDATGLATWDARRLGAAIAGHYRASVQDEPARQLQTSLKDLSDLAAGGDAEGRARRPTLFDLLAQRAIAGLQNQELTLTEPEEKFDLSRLPAAALFGPAADFVALQLDAPAADSLNHQLLTLRLLQTLTAARQPLAQRSPEALADVDLQRLRYLRDQTRDTDLADLYEPALAREAETYKALPISTEFLAALAQARREAGQFTEAVALARQAEARFPKSRGAAQARALREDVERATLSFAAAEVVVPGQPWRLDLTGRNLGQQLHAWAYKISAKDWADFNPYGYNQAVPLRERYARFFQKAPAATWTLPVPARADHQEQKLTAAGPALPAGYYLVVVSTAAAPPSQAPPAGAAVSYAALGASQLSALSRARPGGPLDGQPQLLVLDRQTGAPLAGVAARASYQRYDPQTNRQVSRPGEVLRTDADGLVSLAPPLARDAGGSNERLERVRLGRGADSLLVRGLSFWPGQGRERTGSDTTTKCFLFTDRAIYRPGQTVYFKGIVVQKTGDQTRLLTGRKQEIELEDPNGDTVQELAFTTNDFGSFHGSFVLPTGRLNGQFKLTATQDDEDSELTFQVEDYKRPTFFVQLDSAGGRPQLGQPLTLTGRAQAYAGPATDEAAVRYRVVRRELWLLDYRFPGGYPRGGQDQEVAHGTATTDAEGRFALTFTPPAPTTKSRPRRGGYEPGYQFEVTVDVTDAAGETRSASRAYVIGRNPLTLRLAGPEQADKQKLPAFQLFSQNATGEARPARGTLRLLARRFRPLPPGVPGPPDETADTELPAQEVAAQPFDTQAGPTLDLARLLAEAKPGRYRLEAQAAAPDSAARAQLDFVLFDAASDRVPFATPDWVVAPQDSVRPGQPATLLVGSSEADTHVLLETERGGRPLQREWLTLAAGEQRRLSLPSGPAAAGGGPLIIHTTQVRAGRLYRHETRVAVAEPAAPLVISLSTFRDRLQPGQRETWRLTIRQTGGQPAAAELLATLYDQSLDLFRPHGFQALAFGEDYVPARLGWQGEFGTAAWIGINNSKPTAIERLSYPVLNTLYAGGALLNQFIAAIGGPARANVYGSRANGVAIQQGRPGAGTNIRIRGVSTVAAPAPMAAAKVADSSALNEVVTGGSVSPDQMLQGRAKGVLIENETGPPLDLSAIKIRTNFRETAFWEPALRTDAAGNLVLEFQMPEAVTRWQLLALAHDRQLRTGQLARQLVTQKQIQVTPNAPRFLRPGDSFTFAAKVANLTDQPARGTAQLFLLDAATGQDLSAQLLRGPAQVPVAPPARQSQAVGWELSIPADFRPVAITYRVVVSAKSSAESRVLSAEDAGKKRKTKLSTQHSAPSTEFTDGEENTLPVLPNKILITESLPLTLIGAGQREFELKKLTSTTSPTRQNQSLTLELTSRPAWAAVQSLPYLMEYPYECSEQVFSRLYANLVAAHILKSNPRFRAVLAEWQRLRQSGSSVQQNVLASKLAQNEDLKNLLLQETPWVQDARSETERLARLSTLFDEARLQAETTRALTKLTALQLPDGSFPWFERMPADRYLSQLLVAGFGKLRQLGAFDAAQDPTAKPLLIRALAYVDRAVAQDYAEHLRQAKAEKSKTKDEKPFLAQDNLDLDDIQALYARSFWPAVAVPKNAGPAYDFYRQQAARYWVRESRQLQGQLALALFRHDARNKTSPEILRGLRQNALHSPELGMYWKDRQPSLYWQEAPVETQAVLIEAFDEVARDPAAVDELRLWLLRQKQTQSWPSTRATADACYALLRRGTDWLSAPAQEPQVSLGGEPLALLPGQAGTGYVRLSLPGAEVRPAQGRVSLRKSDAGPAFGALYWQYFEDVDRVTPAASPLSLERQLYREAPSAAGPQLVKLTVEAPLRVGDVLVVRLVLRTDRELEYVHLKDQRAAGLEPINQLSGYRFQASLGYYESPRDAATHFFISRVPRGTHVFEYRLRAAQFGEFSGGLSQIQCLYAPEFGANSAGQRLRIGK